MWKKQKNQYSNWEQVSIVLCYVDEVESIREDFVAFLPCAEITDESIANNIVHKIRDWGLDIENVRGQGYDGAANMDEKIQGRSSEDQGAKWKGSVC